MGQWGCAQPWPPRLSRPIGVQHDRIINFKFTSVECIYIAKGVVPAGVEVGMGAAGTDGEINLGC